MWPFKRRKAVRPTVAPVQDVPAGDPPAEQPEVPELPVPGEPSSHTDTLSGRPLVRGELLDEQIDPSRPARDSLADFKERESRLPRADELRAAFERRRHEDVAQRWQEDLESAAGQTALMLLHRGWVQQGERDWRWHEGRDATVVTVAPYWDQARLTLAGVQEVRVAHELVRAHIEEIESYVPGDRAPGWSVAELMVDRWTDRHLDAPDTFAWSNRWEHRSTLDGVHTFTLMTGYGVGTVVAFAPSASRWLSWSPIAVEALLPGAEAPIRYWAHDLQRALEVFDGTLREAQAFPVCDVSPLLPTSVAVHELLMPRGGWSWYGLGPVSRWSRPGGLDSPATIRVRLSPERSVSVWLDERPRPAREAVVPVDELPSLLEDIELHEQPARVPPWYAERATPEMRV